MARPMRRAFSGSFRSSMLRIPEGRTQAAGMRRTDQPELRIIIGSFRLFVQVQAGKSLGSRDVFVVRGIRQAQEIEVQHALAQVKPVALLGELVVQDTEVV